MDKKIAKKLTEIFDEEDDIVVGDDRKLIMIRSGASGDSEYTITIEKVILDKDDNVSDYEVLSSISMSNGDYETMGNAIEEYVQHGGDLKHIKNII